MLVYQVHASLFAYLEAIQREEDGDTVKLIPVSCNGRVARLLPSQIRTEMGKKTPRAEWKFIPQEQAPS